MLSGFSCRWKGAPASILKDEKDFVIGVLWKIPISELAELDIQGKRVKFENFKRDTVLKVLT